MQKWNLREKLGKEHLDCKSQLGQKVNGQSQPLVKVNGQSQHWSTVWSTMMSADWRVTSADDVAVMTSPRANVSKRNLARDSAWRSVWGAWRILAACGGTWSAWALAQNLLAAREGAWQLRWWLGFHEKVDRWRRILVVPVKTQLEQGSRRRRSGSGLETINDGDCRSGIRDDDWNASEV